MRRAAVLAGVVALAAVAAGAARWPLAPASVAESLNAALGPASALTWIAPQAASFSVLPWPSLRLVDARLADDSGHDVVSAPEARVDLSVVALLLGRAASARVSLTAPTIALDLDRAPFAGGLDSGAAALTVDRLAPLGAVSVIDGVVRATSRKRGLDTVIDSLDGRIGGLAPGERPSVDLVAVWRGGRLTVSGSLDDPRRAVLGRPGAVVVSVSSPLGELAFSGAMTAGPAPGAAGDLAASSRSAAEVARLFGVRWPTTPGLADIAIAGKIKVGPGDVVFDDATLTCGGQTLQGALRLARSDGRVTVSGSLDAARLALAPLLAPPAPLLAPDGRWSGEALPVSPPRGLDLDLRLSAGELDVYGIDFENVAASALLKDAELTATLVDATAFGGRGQGDLRLGRDGDGFRLAARGKFAGVEVGTLGSEFGWPALSGRGTANFAVETAGRSPAELIAGVRGKASIEIDDGVLSGVNLEEALRRSQRRPIDVARDMRSGGTAFQRAWLDAVAVDGVVRIVEGGLVAHGLKADLRGAVDLVDRSLRLQLDAEQSGASGAAPPDAARLGLVIDGPWSGPTVEARSRNDGAEPPSPAAAP